MNHYQELKIQPDREFNLPTLRNKIYQKIHKAIWDLKTKNIGASFPKVGDKLGDTIRIHSTNDELQKLQNLNWIGGLSGYCKVSDIFPVPDKVKGYQTISRIRQTMTEAKLKKRVAYQQKNGDLKTDVEVQAYKNQYRAEMMATGLDNPYLELNSSKGGLYRIYLHFSEIQNNAAKGEFNNFGLSKVANIPIF